MITVTEVKTRKQLKEFINLPRRIYRNSSHWIPPVWADERTAYFEKRNPILKNSTFALFTAYADKRPAGRILAYVDHNFNEYYKTSHGFFGAFEAVDDPGVSSALFAKAEAWLSVRGVERIRGPINPVAEHWGFLFDGFDQDPVFLSPYNPAYYNTAAEKAGYTKIKDLLAYLADMGSGYRIPERFETFKDKFFERNPQFGLRRIDPRNIVKDAEIIWRLSNESLKDNWGFVPVERDVMEDMIHKLKMILDPDAVWFVEDGGRAVGFCLGYPDINIILKKIKGRLFPLGFARLLTKTPKLRNYRLFGLGVLPEYHGRGLDVLLYTQLQSALAYKDVHMEANYILEDNPGIRNALEKLGMTLTKTYRVYEKSLSK